MELAPRYKLLALLTMLRLVTHTIAFHCLNISKYAYIYYWGKSIKIIVTNKQQTISISV